MISGLPLLGCVLAVMMVSDRRYPDWTKLYARGEAPWWPLIALIVLGLLTAPPVGFALFYLGYAARGLFGGPYRSG